MTILANAGLPAIFMFSPPALLTLIPIVLVQALIGRHITALPGKRTALVSAAVNLLSTGAGVFLIPLPMILGAQVLESLGGSSDFAHALYAVAMQAPWLYPYEGHMVWLLPAAAILLTLPCLLVSLVLQFAATRLLCLRTPSGRLWGWTWRANLAAYAILLCLILFAWWLNPFWEGIASFLHPVAAPIIDWFVIGGK